MTAALVDPACPQCQAEREAPTPLHVPAPSPGDLLLAARALGWPVARFGPGAGQALEGQQDWEDCCRLADADTRSQLWAALSAGR